MRSETDWLGRRMSDPRLELMKIWTAWISFGINILSIAQNWAEFFVSPRPIFIPDSPLFVIMVHDCSMDCRSHFKGIGCTFNY